MCRKVPQLRGTLVSQLRIAKSTNFERSLPNRTNSSEGGDQAVGLADALMLPEERGIKWGGHRVT
ncbi:hypothetical protein KL918_004356, partial [Ogataea parapolymorpha]